MTNKTDRTSEAEAISLLQRLRRVTLSATETQAMRERLSAYIQLHGPLAMAEVERAINPFSARLFIFSQPFLAVLSLALILTGTTGASYAAQDTLPGEPLYAVKVGLTEPLIGAFITTPAAKGQWENTLTDRRLTEASTLASKGSLATSTQQYLAQAVISTVALSQKESDTLDASGQSTTALQVRSDLDARLSAHAELLSLIVPSTKAAGNGTTTSALLALITTVHAQQAAVQTSRIASEKEIVHTTVAVEAATSTPPHETRPVLATALAPAVPATTSIGVIHTLEVAVADSPSRDFVADVSSARQAEQKTLLITGAAKLGIALPVATTTATTTLTLPDGKAPKPTEASSTSSL
jgi:hypothetical protein